MMKFIIRDDDTNFFTKPDDILRLYKEVFEKGIPVGLSVIPFVCQYSDVYPWNISSQKYEYPINENKELSSYINSNPLIEVMQHGCTHIKINNIFEYQNKKGLFSETRRGKKILEETFISPIRVFVPPHDQISNHGILAVEDSNMDIIRSKGSKNFIPRLEYFSVFLKMVLHKIYFILNKKEKRPAYPVVVNLGKHKEAFSFRIELGVDSLKNGLDYIKNKNGDFVLVLHLHSFDEKMKENLLEIIKYAKELGFNFDYPHKLFS